LRWLNLSETTIGDAAAGVLRQLADLERLSLRKTNMSVTAIQQLRRALPRCMIEDPDGRTHYPFRLSTHDRIRDRQYGLHLWDEEELWG
jgi:hypothetical protein